MQNLYSQYQKSKGVSTDTRTMKKGELFFALSGDNFNGNIFVAKALEKGAYHVVCDDNNYQGVEKVTVVDDALNTLQELAQYHRKQFKFPIIALTGSNGKTTTKELILSVLSESLNVKATAGNYNNHIGVPLTLLSFDLDLDAGIVEMGANHQKEIEALCHIAQPDYGLITNYGKAHLEGFGGIEGVKKGKSEMYDYLRSQSKTAIVGRWDEEQLNRSANINCIFTIDNTSLVSIDPFITLMYDQLEIHTALTGHYNYNNILFAITVAETLQCAPLSIKEGLEKYIPTNNRSQIIEKENCRLILDAYNANPSSMIVALNNLAKQKAPVKNAVLGDMFELGEYSEEEHQKIADLAADLEIQNIHLIGSHFYKTKTAAHLHETFEDFEDYFSSIKKEGIYLIKGSRGMQLERTLNLFN